MSQNEIDAIKKVFPEFTRSIGQAMWCVFTGNFENGRYRNVFLPSGELCQHTWRMWGQIIADARGHKKEDYSTYWESRVPEAKAKSVEKKFKKVGWKFSEEFINLDSDEKFRDEMLKMLSVSGTLINEIPDKKTNIEMAKKIFNNSVYGAVPTQKKRGRPPKVK